MIALKSVKTLPATMLAVERDEFSGGGPRRRRRSAACFSVSPRVAAWSFTAPLFTCWRGRGGAIAGSDAEKLVQ
jgi:hypothetical protein